MFEQLEATLGRFEELEREVVDPRIIADPELWQKRMRERSDLEELVKTYLQWKAACENEIQSQEILKEEKDPDLLDLAKEELEESREAKEKLTRDLNILLLPKDPNDERDVFLEIRAGAGGEESALFATELYRMYTRYVERKGWNYSVVSFTESERGGYREIVIEIHGRGAYSRLKYESGVQRVQRVPVTESVGRTHSSLVTVAVMPQVDDVEVEIRPEDIRIDVFRSSGAGGQHVNKTDSAVRITHFPSGIVVSSQNERSQIQNREQGMKVLRARLYERMLQERQEAIEEQRFSQIGTGERSDKIRTYNFNQTRITDHRIGYTVYKMDGILNGDLDELIDLLTADDQARKLAESINPNMLK